MGGEDGEFFADMKDYFYYSQIRSQGEDTTKARTLDGTLPAEEIPHLMCALGYFPTQLEIENMITEIKYSKFAETGEVVERVHFEDFVRLYVNHRPVFAVGPKQVAQALEAMTKQGEKMSIEELEDCLLKLVNEGSVQKVLGDEF